MENIWFDGGAWTCAWGAGVIQYLKKDYPDLLRNYKNVGGYSAGGYLALNVHLKPIPTPILIFLIRIDSFT